MKRIEALLPHDMIQTVEQTLTQLGIRGLTLSSVFTTSTPPANIAASPKKNRLGSPSCKLDLLVSDQEVAEISKALIRIANGKSSFEFCIMNVEATIRIRTGESEEAAIR